MTGMRDRQPAVIAAFDFDGTLTRRDTMFRFTAWRRPAAGLAADLLLTLPLTALYAARLVDNERPKMALFARRFAGMPADAFQQLAHEFSETRLPGLLRADAMERLRHHRELRHRVVIVTASPIDWIAPWARANGVATVIGNTAEVREGRLTGRLSGPNCHGREKVTRLLAQFPERSAYTLIAYGDSRGDRELLAAADERFYGRFA